MFKRSLSVPAESLTIPLQILRSTLETKEDEDDNDDEENDEVGDLNVNQSDEDEIENLSSTNGEDDRFDMDINEATTSITEDQLSSLKCYPRDSIRRRTSIWYGSSTIEIQNQEIVDDQIHSNLLDPKKTDDDIINKIEYNSARRLISKNGYQNVTFKHVPRRSVRYCKDLITTLIEQQWGFTLTLFTGTFFASWFIFACLWYLIARAHGDLDFDEVTGKRLGSGRQPCVFGATDMTGMFIHSLELQSTIGFGERYPTEECPEGVLLFVIQIIISIAIEGAMVAVVYAKMSKPVKQISKLSFSKTACVHYRDGKLCLVFRVCDPRQQKTIATKIRAYLVMDIETMEHETMKVNQELLIEGNGNCLIMWPETVCHVIDATSPFYEFTAQDFNTRNYEIFVSLVGYSPTTGQQTESRTSYLSQEISWGHRFTNVILYNRSKENYIIDYDQFHTTVEVDTTAKTSPNTNTIRSTAHERRNTSFSLQYK